MAKKKSEAFEELHSLWWKAEQEQYKHMPPHAIPSSPREAHSDSTANGLTRCIKDYIKLRGGYCVRISVEGRYIPGKYNGNGIITPGHRIKSSTEKGTSDLHACIHGRHVSIEVKGKGDRQRPEQKKVQQDVENAGGIYLIATSFNQFHQWYNQTFINTPL